MFLPRFLSHSSPGCCLTDLVVTTLGCSVDERLRDIGLLFFSGKLLLYVRSKQDILILFNAKETETANEVPDLRENSQDSSITHLIRFRTRAGGIHTFSSLHAALVHIDRWDQRGDSSHTAGAVELPHN